VGTATSAKPANENGVTTGSDAAKPANTVDPNPNPENLSTKGKAKARTAKPANENAVTTGFGVELSDSEHESPQPVPSTSLCEPFRDAVELGLSQGRNAMGIWQDLVSESGFNGGYQTVKRFVRKLRGNQPPQPRAVIITAPGEESQVDYGTGPMVRDPQTGKYRRTRLFVLTLGCSRKAVRLLSFRSSSRIWAEILPARQVVVCAPWQIPVDALDSEAIRKQATDLRNQVRVPQRQSCEGQQLMFSER